MNVQGITSTTRPASPRPCDSGGMSDDPWGASTPPAFEGEPPPLPPELAQLARFVAGAEPERWPRDRSLPTELDLPEVQALAEQGWQPVSAAPETRLLPAVWPAEHRCWVADRLPPVMLAMTEERAWVERVPPSRLAEWQHEAAAEAAAAGQPAPPPGRIWLLRSPWPALSTEMVLLVLRQWRDDRELWGRPDGLLVAAREILRWPEEQVLRSWTGRQADAAAAWRATGRPPHEVAPLVLVGLTPAGTSRLTEPVDQGGAGLSEAQAVEWAEAVMGVEDADPVDAIIGWRSLGLPAQPPPRGRMMFLCEMAPAEAAAWLAAGFSFDDVSALFGLVTLAEAGRWRERGYAAPRVRELVLADRMLTPDEARAFEDAGLDGPTVTQWVAAGFTAAEARAWSHVDVLPNEARVWRSQGLGPDDARRQKEAGGGELPAGVALGWMAFGENRRETRVYGATDPPETRGRLAEEDREMRQHLDE